MWRAVLLAAAAVCAGVEVRGQGLEGQGTRDEGRGIRIKDEGKGIEGWEKGKRVFWSDALWKVTFRDGTAVTAGACAASRKEGAALRLEYRTPEIDLDVEVTEGAEGFDFRAEVKRTTKTVLEVALPASLRFAPAEVEKVLFPQNGSDGLGLALSRTFYEPFPAERPAGWRPGAARGPGVWRQVAGAPLRMADPKDATPLPLRVTDAGAKIFSKALRARVEVLTVETKSLRAPVEAQRQRVLVDTPAGPWLCGSSLGGTGLLWRVCAGVGREAEPVARAAAGALLESRLRESRRGKLGVIALRNGPANGFFNSARVKDWVACARAAATACGKAFVELRTAAQVEAALGDGAFACVLNPLGEAFPVAEAGDAARFAAALRGYVRAGGEWFETGGYPFYVPLLPERRAALADTVPRLGCDFFHLTRTDGGGWAVYGVQPRPPHAPWRNARESFYTPAWLRTGSDDAGGEVNHAFKMFVEPGATGRTPAARVAFGGDGPAALAAYGRANGFGRTLADKVRDPAKLAAFKRAFLLKLHGTFAEMTAAAKELPGTSLVHISNYLKGGFDKEYPDHLPPNPRTGTEAEFRAFLAALRAHGHLFTPYTNPTWWCDHPRGPSFLAAGEAPLRLDLEGKPTYEKYAKNDGWTVTFWHPAVMEANRRTVRQFTREFPCDMLFQDQCGVRAAVYDLNPASPAPTAYVEGVLAMNEEDSAVVPLGTENGWDRSIENQTYVCGMSWGFMPVRASSPAWVRCYKSELAPEVWTYDPLVLRLFHGTALFTHHDLGRFVNNAQDLAWTLAFGYQLSGSIRARAYLDAKPPKARAWYAWLARAQAEVCARYAGEPLAEWRHDRGPLFARAEADPVADLDDGTVAARYGGVRVRVNLGDVPRAVDGARLAPYGFLVETADGARLEYLEGMAAPRLRTASGEVFAAPE